MRRKTSKTDRLYALERSFPFRIKRLYGLFNLFRAHNYFPPIDRSGRLYTLLVQLPEPVRHFLTFKGERLASLDLKNSQPFHFCSLLKARFWSTKAHRLSLKAIQPALYTALEKAGTLPLIRKHIRETGASSDVKQYVTQVTTGLLYEYLADRYGGKYKSMCTRDRAKLQFMRFLYSNPLYKYSDRNAAYREWAADFPNVSALLELVKRDNHTFLAKMLQALEAKLLLQLVVSEFVKAHPGVFISSVHDSLLTVANKKEELEAIISQVYRRELQLVPMVEVKVLCPENAFSDLPKYIQKKISAIK